MSKNNITIFKAEIKALQWELKTQIQPKRPHLQLEDILKIQT